MTFDFIYHLVFHQCQRPPLLEHVPWLQIPLTLTHEWPLSLQWNLIVYHQSPLVLTVVLQWCQSLGQTGDLEDLSVETVALNYLMMICC